MNGNLQLPRNRCDLVKDDLPQEELLARLLDTRAGSKNIVSKRLSLWVRSYVIPQIKTYLMIGLATCYEAFCNIFRSG